MKNPSLAIRFAKVGNRMMAFPASDTSRTFAELEAAPTLTGRALAIAKKLGFEIVVINSSSIPAATLAAYLNPDGRAS